MTSPRTIPISSQVVNHLITRIQQQLAGDVEKIILYGSYARGEAEPDSDVDIIALICFDSYNVDEARELLVDIALELSLEFDLNISIMPQDYNEFEKWLPYIPFFQNVKREGIVLYERSGYGTLEIPFRESEVRT
jgi:predicted nucleotidyltransferase